ncbi:Phage envelope protein [Sphingomonas paucimobilis]|nr:Phage envelope protein [Sphingomonas paucimobilis]
MDAERIAVAKTCLDAAHDGSLSYPDIIGTLVTAGFEGYAVDYRRNTQVYYLPDGDNIELAMPHATGSVAAAFDADGVEALVRWAQANGPDYSYAAFCEKVKAAGCAGYLVSFLGRRVVYYGRTAETHVELFPQ